MSQTNNIIEKAEKNIIHTYNRYQIALERGEGVYLYDAEGRKYLDFGSGIGVFALGYGNKEYNDALKLQVDRLVHTSNYFYNEPAAEAAEKLVRATGLAKVFFTNSGAEAVEGALKLARKYSCIKSADGGLRRSGIIAMEQSFHGRTMGSLSVTGNPHYREAFEPLLPEVSFARYNDLESVRALANDNTCAIIMETVQGEGGIRPADEAFIKGVRRLCDERDILLILDEIQCGMGRSGQMFAYQCYGVKPDIVTSAKALGCGVPIGAFAASEKVADVLAAGDHGTTYGGNPLACAAASKVFDIFERNKILENVRSVGAYLYERLDEIAKDSPRIVEHRGIGLMQGLEFDAPVGGVISRLLDCGLVTFSAGGNVVRFIPPLVISRENVDEMIDKLKKCI
ncbi:MAG: aspartate aminotransferase family protein [Butyrivibrio sp.]|nr:aspartate aminotransferase family protein [Butyrivibrio sp.]